MVLYEREWIGVMLSTPSPSLKILLMIGDNAEAVTILVTPTCIFLLMMMLEEGGGGRGQCH